MKKILKFKKGEQARIDELEIIFRYLPLGIRKQKGRLVAYNERHMADDIVTENYFNKDCKVTIEFEEEK